MSLTPTELTSFFNWLFLQSQNNDPYVYVLKLSEGKYYVGYTENIYNRLCQHFDGEGSKYTKIYPPINVIKIIPHGSETIEKLVTLEMMKKYGRQNVRGGPWTSFDSNCYFPNNNTINETPIAHCSDI